MLLNDLPEGKSELITPAINPSIAAGRVDYLKSLLAHGAIPDQRSLSKAIEKENLEAVEMLLAAGISPDDSQVADSVKVSEKMFDRLWEKSSRPAITLATAVVLERQEIGLKIINSVEDINAEGGLGTTLLGCACKFILPDLVEAALDRGADPKLRDSKGELPLTLVAGRSETWKGSEEDMNKVVELLLAAGAEIDAKNADGNSAIILAARGGDASRRTTYAPQSVIRRLLAAAPDPHQTGAKGITLAATKSRLVSLYGLLHATDRDQHVWRILDRNHTKFSDHPIRLSEMLIDTSALHFDPKIKIYRPGKFAAEEIDYSTIVAAGDPAADPLLEPGTMVEIGYIKNKEFDADAVRFLVRASSKKIAVSRGDHHWNGETRYGINFEPGVYDPSQGIVMARTVSNILDAMYAPKDLSDLTRIEIKHSDGSSTNFNYIIAESNRTADVTLRDGDHIVLQPTRPDPTGKLWLSRESDLFLRPIRDSHAGFNNQIDLAEFIAAAYSDAISVLPSPDFDNITVRRGEETIKAQLSDQPFELQPGDIVNIPAKPEPDPEWNRLDDATIQLLQKLLARGAGFQTAGGPARELKVGPQFYQFDNMENGRRSVTPVATPGDKAFDVLGLSAPVAIRNLGYQPDHQLSVKFQLSKRTAGDISPKIRVPEPFPIIEHADKVLIKIAGNRSRKVPAATNSSRPSTRSRYVVPPKQP